MTFETYYLPFHFLPAPAGKIPDDLPAQSRAIRRKYPQAGGAQPMDARELFAEQFRLTLVISVGRERTDFVLLGHRERRWIAIDRRAREQHEPTAGRMAAERV